VIGCAHQHSNPQLLEKLLPKYIGKDFVPICDNNCRQSMEFVEMI
jgi:hypothetical protein